MIKIPSIKCSAQARLLLYRLLSLKLTDTEHKLLSSEPSLWDKIIVHLEAMLTSETQTKSDEVVLTQAFSFIEKTTTQGLNRQIERLTGQPLWLGIHPSALLDSFISEHQKLIKSVQREYMDKIILAIKRGIREGRLQKDITKDICQITDLSKRRAQLIARNAPLQYGGTLTKHHQVSSGITHYRWQTSQDEKVRTSHRSRNNIIYNWNSPGPHPRSEVNCRCDAVPIIPGLNY
jgi:SPP1 gp7 family putative phage head morphogenesis protein